MTDNKRIKNCKRKVIAAINEAKLPFAVSELILENVLNAVRENMAAEEAEAANSEAKKDAAPTGVGVANSSDNAQPSQREE